MKRRRILTPEQKEALRLKRIEYKKKNAEKIAAKNKEYREANKEKIKKYREENKEKLAAIQKEYREANKEKLLEKTREWKEKNSDRVKKQNMEYREKNPDVSKKWKKENPDKAKAAKKRYYDKHKEKLSKISRKYYQDNKIKINEKLKEKYKTNILFKISLLSRNMISKAIKRKGYTKKSKTIEILGCSFEEFKLHLESKFEPWMNWDNYGKYNGELNYGWDVDHIVPLSSATNEAELIKLNHFTNLQPLCSKINRDIKAASI